MTASGTAEKKNKNKTHTKTTKKKEQLSHNLFNMKNIKIKPYL